MLAPFYITLVKTAHENVIRELHTQYTHQISSLRTKFSSTKMIKNHNVISNSLTFYTIATHNFLQKSTHRWTSETK